MVAAALAKEVVGRAAQVAVASAQAAAQESADEMAAAAVSKVKVAV